MYSAPFLIRRAVSLVGLSLAVVAPAARAADPILPLAEVRPGMRCTGLSVVRGTEIASFDVEVIDVIADDPAFGGARLLVRVSGPAVDATGVGPGFSGSPIICGGRNAGAISEGIGEYGNKVVLATPIEAILTARPRPAPAGARRAPRLLAASRPLAGPLTVSGVSPGTRRLLARAARRARRTLFAAPPGPQAGYPVQDLRPGSAVAASISSGDVSVAAIGTVAYRDGADIYAFGHALDALGSRSLFMQDVYVFGVIGNPLGVPDLGATTYKLTSSGGHDVGTVTTDTFSAISGTLGAGPPSFPLTVTARDKPNSKTVVLGSRVADERSLGQGGGLSLVAPLAAQTAIDRLENDLQPVTISLCTRFRVRQLRRPIGFCNTYFEPFSAVEQVAEAAAMVESFDLAPLDIRGTSVSVAAARGVVEDVIVGAEGPRRVRAGDSVPVRVALRRRGGRSRSVGVRVPVPRDLDPGRRTLIIEGTSTSVGEQEIIIELARGLAGPPAGRSLGPAQAEPESVRDLARQVASLIQPQGVSARFRGRERRLVLRSDDVHFDGRAKVSLKVLRRARR